MTITVAHVNVARGYRGGERQTELLIRGLARHGVRQILVARRAGMLAARLADTPTIVRPVSGHIVGVARATTGADLIHVHEGRSVYAAYLRSLLAGTPYVITRRVNNPIRHHWFAEHAYRRAAYVVGVAPQVAEVVRAYDGAIHVAVIHSSSSALAVDAGQAAAIRGAHSGKLIVGHVGALDNAQKGQEYIIAVARRLQTSHPDVHFMLVGGGADEAMLKARAAGLHNVTFTGFVENVGDYLAAFDVFVLPSNREGIGSILLDAMDRELPVVASHVGGVPDIVHDGVNGILIEPARPEQLEAGILRLRQAPELRRELGRRGREFAKRFTAEVMSQKYLDIYRQVLGRRD